MERIKRKNGDNPSSGGGGRGIKGLLQGVVDRRAAAQTATASPKAEAGAVAESGLRTIVDIAARKKRGGGSGGSSGINI